MTVGQDEAVAPSPNADLFVAVLAQIEKHPKTWEQGMWRTACGTAFCFAGWACEINGAQWAEIQQGDVMYRYVRTDTGRRYAGHAAADALCIGAHDADKLFGANNTLGHLYRVSAGLLGIDEQVLRDKVAAVVADGATQAVPA